MDTILLVEDNDEIMELNEWYLKKQGYKTERAYSLAQARKYLRYAAPDLIILDVLLPDGDGISFCTEIRRTHSAPVLFLTGVTSDKDVMAGYRSGGNDYLTKPYDLDMLGVRVKALLDFSKRVRSGEKDYLIGPLRFVIHQSEAFVQGEPLNLSRKEFNLLFFLARHHGETVEKETLLREVWGVENGAYGSALWTAASRLKKKISPFADLFYLDSDHSGYTLIIPRFRKRQREAKE